MRRLTNLIRDYSLSLIKLIRIECSNTYIFSQMRAKVKYDIAWLNTGDLDGVCIRG